MKKIAKIIVLGIALTAFVCLALMLICNQIVVNNAEGKCFSDIDSIKYNKVGLLLGTTPQARITKVKNYFFIYRLDAAEQLYKAGKIETQKESLSCFYNEITLYKDTPYLIDIDFDGDLEKICRGERGDIFVFKKDKSGDYTVDVSSEKPFCWIRINPCCPAHMAYTTINYAQRTIYSEAHYGCCEYMQKVFQKVGNTWEERLPIRPLSILSKELFPETHHNKRWLCCDSYF